MTGCVSPNQRRGAGSCGCQSCAVRLTHDDTQRVKLWDVWMFVQTESNTSEESVNALVQTGPRYRAGLTSVVSDAAAAQQPCSHHDLFSPAAPRRSASSEGGDGRLMRAPQKHAAQSIHHRVKTRIRQSSSREVLRSFTAVKVLEYKS